MKSFVELLKISNPNLKMITRIFLLMLFIIYHWMDRFHLYIFVFYSLTHCFQIVYLHSIGCRYSRGKRSMLTGIRRYNLIKAIGEGQVDR